MHVFDIRDRNFRSPFKRTTTEDHLRPEANPLITTAGCALDRSSSGQRQLFARDFRNRTNRVLLLLTMFVWIVASRDAYAVSKPGTPVAAVTRNPSQLDLFITGNDGVVYTSWWTAGSDWSGLNGWRAIGGFFPADAPVTAVSRNPNQLDLFVVGNDGVVYTSWWTAGSDWSGINNNWRAIGGYFPPGSPVAAVSRNPNQLDLFVVGNNGVIYTSWWTAGSDWSGINNNWRAIGGYFPPGSPLAAVSRNPNQLDLFVVGYNDVVYTSWWMAGSDWSGINNSWRAIGGYFPPFSPVAAVSRNPNQLDLFITGYDGVVYTSWWAAGSDWSGINNNWRPIGGYFPPSSPVAAVSRNPNQLDLFITGNDGLVYTSWWTAGSDWSGINNNWRLIDFYPTVYNCAHCNDGTCQCGSGTAAQLCAAHNGYDPTIGCVQESKIGCIQPSKSGRKGIASANSFR